MDGADLTPARSVVPPSDLTPRTRSGVTGSSRKLKDNAADWHNLILKWARLNDEGAAIANKITNLGISKGSLKEELQALMEDGEGDTAAAPRSETPASLKHSNELGEECAKLVEVVDKMSRIVSKMERLVSSERGVVDLEVFQHGAAGGPAPLFLTWPTTHFVEVSTQLYQAYSQELCLKQAILQEVAHTASQDLSLVYLSCWLHQPYIDDRVRLHLEALLLETGHRPL